MAVNENMMVWYGHVKYVAKGKGAVLAAGLETLQALRSQVSMEKYQRLKKDLEPQVPGGWG